MNITEHEMRGLLTGKCIPGDMKVNEQLSAYLVRKFSDLHEQLTATTNSLTNAHEALKSAGIEADTVQAGVMELKVQRDALAAENAAMKSGIADITFMKDDDFFGSTSEAQRVMGHLVNIQAPATEAHLNAVRVEGIDYLASEAGEMAQHFKQGSSDWKQWKSIVFFAVNVAAQLRAGNAGKDGSHE